MGRFRDDIMESGVVFFSFFGILDVAALNHIVEGITEVEKFVVGSAFGCQRGGGRFEDSPNLKHLQQGASLNGEEHGEWLDYFISIPVTDECTVARPYLYKAHHL